MNIYDVVKRPLITEKAAGAQATQQYTFEVDRRATKPMIRNAIEQLFRVKVLEVRTNTIAGKTKRNARARGRLTTQSDWKKAVVKLAAGQKIDVIEGA